MTVADGAYVFIVGRRQNEVDTAVNQIGKIVTGVQGDVSNLSDLDRLYDTVKQQKGGDPVNLICLKIDPGFEIQQFVSRFSIQFLCE